MSPRPLERLYVYWMVSTILLLALGVVVSLLFWGQMQAQSRRLAQLEAQAAAMDLSAHPAEAEHGEKP